MKLNAANVNTYSYTVKTVVYIAEHQLYTWQQMHIENPCQQESTQQTRQT